MATGLQATLSANSSAVYTPATNAKVTIAWANSAPAVGGVKINGVYGGYTTSTTNTVVGEQFWFYAAAGVPVTIATDANINAVVSSIEE